MPLLGVMVIGGAGITWTFAGTFSKITGDALPQERALDGIRSASLALLSAYREAMIAQSDSTRREVAALQERLELAEATFERDTEHS